MVRGLWSHRRLVKQLAVRDLSSRFRGSFLGLFWSLLTPLIILGIYTIVFSLIMGQKWPEESGRAGHGQFALFLFAGLLPYNMFAEVIGRSATQVTSVPNYVKRVVFPLEILTPVNLWAAVANMGIGLGMFLVVELLLMRSVPWTTILFPLVVLPLMLLAAAVSWVLGALGAYIRDIAQFVGLALTAVLFLSPIFWPVARASERLRPLLGINPLTPVAEATRSVLVKGTLPGGDVCVQLGVWFVLASVLAWAGHAFFVYTKRGFADVI